MPRATSAACPRLVRHFGDLADARKRLRHLRFLRSGRMRRAAVPDGVRRGARSALRVVAALRAGDAKSTGKLHSELYPPERWTAMRSKKCWERWRARDWSRLIDAVFEKDGKRIPYRKASLTREGAEVDETTRLDFVMKADVVGPSKPKRKKKTARKTAAAAAPRSQPRDARVEEALRSWRLKEAKRRGVPAFRIFSDKALNAIAVMRPASARELLAIPTIGMNTVEKYGAQIFRVLHESGL